MKCCPECFGDRGLRRSIFPLRATAAGRCSYCDSENVPVLDPPTLAEYFELVISAYRLDVNGKPLITWFREDWGMFRHPRMDDIRAGELLADILDDSEIVARAFIPPPAAEANRLLQWEQLRDELMYRNRYFPGVEINLNRLALLLSPLTIEAAEIPNVWYRARIRMGDGPYPIGEMGPPPRRTASHGRANPAGIPYLYLGSTPDTAIAEIRPHTGEIACVADFKAPDDLKLVDLRWPREMVSPFLLEDAGDISSMRADLPFLERLGEELTRPVLPQAAAIDYTPSQYLCEFIKKRGYGGVVYRSSVSDGINLALFNPERATPGSVAQYKVARVTVAVAAQM